MGDKCSKWDRNTNDDSEGGFTIGITSGRSSSSSVVSPVTWTGSVIASTTSGTTTSAATATTATTTATPARGLLRCSLTRLRHNAAMLFSPLQLFTSLFLPLPARILPRYMNITEKYTYVFKSMNSYNETLK